MPFRERALATEIRAFGIALTSLLLACSSPEPSGCPWPTPDAKVVHIQASEDATMAVFSDGRVACWGRDNFGSCALGEAQATDLDGPTWTSLTCMADVDQAGTIGVRMDGTVLYWGIDWQGQRIGQFFLQPGIATVIPGIQGPRSFGYGATPFIITQQNQYLWWGGLKYTQKDILFQDNPGPLAGLPPVKLSTGACAIDLEGGVWCWGHNRLGVLGDPSLPEGDGRLEPKQVLGLPPAKGLMSSTSNCAIARDDGSVWCWGDNSVGQLGRGAFTPQWDATPAPVVGLTGVRAVVGGFYTTCAVTDLNSVLCWGSNYVGGPYGSIDTGTDLKYSSPHRIPGLDDVVEVGVGEAHICALRRDHTVWCQGAWDGSGRVRGQVDLSHITRLPPFL